MYNPIQILLSCLRQYVEFHTNPTVFVCRNLWNPIEILLFYLRQYVEYHPDPTVQMAVLCRKLSNSTVLSVSTCRTPYKSYCLVRSNMQNPIQNILFFLCQYVESHLVFINMYNPMQILRSWLHQYVEYDPNPTVLSTKICRIPSKSYCLVCINTQNFIQILLSSSAVICRIPSKFYCFVYVNMQNPIQILLSFFSNMQNPIQIQS